MIAAYGSSAERFARGLGDFDAILTELEYIDQAYLEAVRRRELGETFYAMLFVDDPRTRLTAALASTVLAQVAGVDERRSALEQLATGTAIVNGKPVSEMWGFDGRQWQLAVELLTMADAVLVRSYAEYAWISSRTGRPPRPVERAVVEPQLPAFERKLPSEPSVVVWAPFRRAGEVALEASALAEFRGEITIVSAGGPLPEGVGGTFLAPGDVRVADALSRAACVICAEPSNPGDAVAFARLGVGVVASAQSGAAELVQNVVLVDPAVARSLPNAVAIASGRPASIRVEPALPPRAPGRPVSPVPAGELPLVSIVTPTLNRPEDLRTMLQCVAAQTYPRIEAIVINDGGAPLDEITAGFPFATLVNLEKNVGAIAAVNHGTLLTKGAFIGYLPDDDWLYPDHVERLVYAMLRSGASIGHSNTLIRYQADRPDGTWATTAFNCSVFAATTTPSEAMIATPCAGQSLMFRREVFAEVGEWRVDSILADQEFQTRAAQRYLFAYVDNVTGEWRSRTKGNASSIFADKFPDEMRRIFDELHPAPGRPMLQQQRDAAVANVRRRPPGQPPFSPTLVLN